MATDNYNLYDQVYNVREDNGLLMHVSQVICVLMPRGVMITGFDKNRELLTIHYRGYNKNKPVWELDFFEQLFANEPLFAAKERIKAAFILNDKELIVPEALYDRGEAEAWIKKIHFIEPGDKIEHFQLPGEKAQYVIAFPVNIAELIKINFKNANVQPLSVYQFKGTEQQKTVVHICVTAAQACFTLHSKGQLLWHKVLDYAQGSDIAFELKHFCRENKIAENDLEIKCDTVSAAEFRVLNEFSQYFNGIKAGTGIAIRGHWDGAISLAQQLLACV